MSKIYFFPQLLILFFASTGLFYNTAYAVNSAEVTQWLACRRQCNAEVWAKYQDYTKGDCNTRCPNPTNQKVIDTTTSSNINTSADAEIESSAIIEAKNRYRDRYVQKCLDTYKNNPDATACCGDLATEDAKVMQKRGVFDTPTTAEVPIIVDELKCKAVEYKYKCSDYNRESDIKSGKKEACEQHLNRCIELGKYIDWPEESRKKFCESDYVFEKPLQLTPKEKYLNYCSTSDKFKQDGEDAKSRMTRCWRTYDSSILEYRDRCVTAMNGANYNPFSNWFIKLRSLFRPSVYKSQSDQCVTRFYQAIDKMTGL